MALAHAWQPISATPLRALIMQSLEDVQLPELHTLGYVVLATLAFVLGRAALNIWLSPVAHVPGPRLAAAT